MYLKSLELHGFKSFPDRTVLKFSGGTTVIVGPNGSGKSNITDAMRWVLGELSSKNIRGSKMEDVIFAGADDVRPMSFAEVSVTFDDSAEPRTLRCPYEEVTVTRRYYRSGDSEYFINRKKCRLRDIVELFLNTGVGREGYSIIGQGRIAEIISKKSEDRRGVFEESAGISRFRWQKSESEKKLAETEANMERVGDIENELAARVGPLEKEAEKARRYLDLYAEKKKTDVSLWLYDEERLKTAIRKSEEDTELSAHELEMAQDSLGVTAAQIERLYEQSHSNKEASRRNYEQTTETVKRMNEAQSDAKVLERERIHAESALEGENKLIEAAEKTRAQEADRLAAARERIASLDADAAQIRQAADELSEKLAVLENAIRERDALLEKMLADRQEKTEGLNDLRVRLRVLENSVADQKKRSATIGSDIAGYRKEIEELDKVCRGAEEQIESYRAAIREIDAAGEKAAEETKSLRDEYAAADAEARAARAQLDSLDSRIAALARMEEHFDGYNNSVRYVMSEARDGRLTGIRGPVSTLITVPKEYIVAVEVTLGAALQNIVTDDEYAAKRAIEALKRSGSGRATFYPLTTIRPQERGRDYDGMERAAGFIGWGDELVSSDDAYRPIVKSLLARVAVFDTLDHAMDAARARGWRVRAVSLDGQQVNAGGSLTGGQVKRDSGMLSRGAQIAAMRRDEEAAKKTLSDLLKKVKAAEEKIALAETESREREERRGLIGALISAESGTFGDADSRRRALGKLVSDMLADSENLAATEAKSADDIAGMKKRIEDAEREIASLTDERGKIAAQRGEVELDASEIAEKLGDMKIRLAEITRDREAALAAAGETEERIAAAEAELGQRRDNAADFDAKIRELGEKAGARGDEAAELSARIDALRERQKTLDDAGDEIEKKITDLRALEKEQTAKKELVFTAHSKNEAKLASLRSDEEKLAARMWEDYELTYATAVRYAEENDCGVIADGERTKYQTRQNELRGKLRALGHVNVDAIEEYSEVKARYEQIHTQLEDLRASRENLIRILAGIEDDMKRLFLDAFGKINTYFGEVFRELFGGGHAEVILTDPDNALESGIEINAAPPGKTIKNLSLLSGGEQAFIAIALLFALIKVNPSPFCIFDEIEAALDEVNVNRVGRYVKKVAESMQIIMISHRRGTMDIADTLYGVTMPKSGVSKVFTLGAGEEKEAVLG